MRETYVYHGHSIDLDLSDIACARIRWTYFIDGRYCIQGETDSSPIDAVRASALALAYRSIDALDAMRSGSSPTPASRDTVSCRPPAMRERGAQRLEATQGGPMAFRMP